MVGDFILVLLPIYFIRKSSEHLHMINGISSMHQLLCL